LVTDCEHCRVGKNNQCVAAGLEDGAENLVHLGQVRRRKIRKQHVELVDNLLRRLTLPVFARMLRPCEDGDVPNLRHPLFEQLDAFAHEIECQITHARKISPWPGEAFHEFGFHRVAADSEYDDGLRVDRSHRVYR
jgi:hypothetical protein